VIERRVKNMKELKTENGYIVLLDNEDHFALKQYRWYAVRIDKNPNSALYAVRYSKGKTVSLHREIMQTPKDMVVNHANHNTLDCQRRNMRNCTHAENGRDCVKQNTTSKYIGVSWIKRYNKWKAARRRDGKKYDLGRFNNEDEAAIAYNADVLLYSTGRVSVNVIGDPDPVQYIDIPI
jgi:hypothetical protein